MAVPANVKVGDRVQIRKTVGESDVYLFAGVTGDLHPNHVDEDYMAGGSFGGRIAHGVLLLGFASAASSKFLLERDLDAVSYGYDRVRFTGPVRLGETIVVDYSIAEIDEEKGVSRSTVEVTVVGGGLAMVATHILKYIR